MLTATVTDFMADVASYLARVEQGEQVCLTNHGQIKARIVPDRPVVRAVLERAEALRAEISHGSTGDDWSAADYLHAGRRES
ncbi:type II toxin-antitoxin system Phd/YefM family antitoxin [Prosthecobacter sp.]|jgi:prevent-host-death family protein|uniref:type II toxin-antitoxin system Phd/YefM family antitoxin n=1 Tax=Prosthecobacter sp. TaxID=1965333 RepID=UPI0037836D20